MPTEDTKTFPSGLDVNKLLRELEVPFSPDQVQWRVTNTTNDKKRGQVVPYADPRAYTDRLNTLFSPQGWTREYKIETMSNVTRMKKGESERAAWHQRSPLAARRDCSRGNAHLVGRVAAFGT